MYRPGITEHSRQRGKGLLRRAVADLLPPSIAYRRKSVYPASPDPAYARALRAQMTELLHQPDAPLFDLVDHGALAAAFAADPMLPGMIGLLPSPYACAAFLLDVNEWLTEYKISLV